MVIMVVTVLPGCGAEPEQQTTPDPVVVEEAAQEVVLHGFENAKVLSAPVVGHADYSIIVDMGHDVFVKVVLARVALNECGNVTGEQLTKAVRKSLPIGSTAVVARSRPLKWKTVGSIDDEWPHDPFSTMFEVSGFVYADAKPKMVGKTVSITRGGTVNEQLVRSGHLRPDPVQELGFGGVEKVDRAGTKEDMGAFDFSYWSKFHAAYMAEWRAHRGLVGVCRTAGEEDRAASLKFQREMKADERERKRDERRRDDQRDSRRSCDGDGDGICNE